MTVTPQLGLNPVPILNMPQAAAKPSESERTTPNKELDLPDITDDNEMCSHCVKCFNEATERLKEAKLIDVRLHHLCVFVPQNVLIGCYVRIFYGLFVVCKIKFNFASVACFCII